MSNKIPRHLRKRADKTTSLTATAAAAAFVLSEGGGSVTQMATEVVGNDQQSPANDPSQLGSDETSVASNVFNDANQPADPELVEPPKNRGDVSPDRLMWVMQKLYTQPLTQGDLFHRLNVKSMAETLESFGCGTVPYIMGLLQEIGVLRWYRRAWYIMDHDFLSESLNQDWVNRSATRLLQHYDTTRDLLEQKRLVESLQQQLAAARRGEGGEEPDSDFMLQVAGLLEDVERLQAEVEQKTNAVSQLESLQAKVDEQAVKIAELELKLTERPKPTKADIAQYLADLRVNLKRS